MSTINTQLYFRIAQGNDVQLGDVNVLSDGTDAARNTIYYGGGDTSSTTAGSGSGNETAVAVDTAAGLVFSVGVGDAGTFDGFQVHNLYTGALISTTEFGADTGNVNFDDVVQSLALDPFTRTLYVNDWGVDQSSTGIKQFTYDTSGNLTPLATNNGFLVTATQNPAITDAIAMYVDVANHKLYYVDDDSGYDFAPFSATNGVYVLDLNNPNSSTELTSNGSGTGQFPVADQSGAGTTVGANGNLVGLAVDVADGIVFFESTDTQGSANNALWWVDANGGANQTAHQVMLPAGVTLNFAGQSSQGGDAAGLSFDPAAKQIYLSDAENSVSTPNTGHLYVLNWNNTSKTVTLATSFDVATLVGKPAAGLDPTDAISATTLDDLPTLTTSGTTTHAVEQGANVTLLTSDAITKPDGDHLVDATVQITGGTFSSNETSANDDHLTINSADRTGTDTSGTINGTSISYSYNSATEKLTLSGYDTLTDYQTALSFVQYFTTGDNPTNYGQNTTRTVTWQANDGAIGDPSGTNTTTTTLNIDAVDDAPVASAPASYAGNEGTALNLHNASLNVSDVDGGITGQNEVATLSVTTGTLHAVAGTGSSAGVQIGGDGTGTLTITGDIAQINGLLNGDVTSTLTASGFVDANDTPNSTTLSLSINDEGFTGSGGPLTSNTAQSTITAPDDTSVTFTGLSSNTTGSPVENQQITATVTDGVLAVGTATYTWKVNGSTVQTGSSNSFTPTESNEGGTLTLDVAFNDPVNASIAENDTNISVGSPNTVHEDPNENASISISGLTAGNAVEGTQLTATVTDADAPASGITYTWEVNNVVVHTGVDGAGNTYTPTENDEGSPISVSVSFTDTHGFSEAGSTSAGTVQENPTENASIAISGLTAGNAVEGTQLTATVTEADAPASGITYTWKVNNVVVHTGVDGAGKTYTPTENDEGSPISVSVSFTDTHGFSETGSASAGTVQESPTENASIAISGLVSGHPQEGTQLTATVTEGDAPASGITYTWTSNNVPVHTGVDGAGNTYTPNHSDDGHTIAVSASFVDMHGFAEQGSASAGTVQNPLVGHMVLTSATEGTALATTTTVATFSDTDNADMAGDFSATINWGDGVTTAGTVVGSNGSFSVQGGHTYADEGSDPANVTVTHTADHVSATASGSVAVAEGDVLAGHGSALKLKANHAFTGVVATFSDTDTANVSGDFTATIVWGDGTTTAGTVSGGSGSLSVSGTHTYTHAGHENIKVTLADDAPGTATATANSTANVSNGPKNDFNGDGNSDLLLQFNPNSAHPDVMVELLNGSSIAQSATIAETKGWQVVAEADFNDDNKGDIVLQNTSDGTPQIWLMNGTSVTSTVTLPSATSSWHIIAAADFNNDGHPDLLFQANNGQVGIWMMNGTSVVSMTGLANPGSSWHVIGAGDFNNDGNADILFQNSDGTPAIWEMNGTSIIATATLPNPGSQWKVIGTGDFNGDGNADILFQENNGTPGVWLMNGTSVVSMTALTNPGAPYTAIGTSDFNGDGMDDILFQRSNGPPLIYEMNGSSIASSFTLPSPGPQWKLQADGPFQAGDAGGSSGTPHLSTPDMAGPTTQTALADPGSNSLAIPGTVSWLTAGAGLHLT